MGPTRGAVTAPLRLAVAVVIGTAMALLVPSLLALTGDGPSPAVLAGVAIAVAAVRWLSSHPATVVATARPGVPPVEDGACLSLAGRVTDPLHHPLRPRAPGPA